MVYVQLPTAYKLLLTADFRYNENGSSQNNFIRYEFSFGISEHK